MEKMLLAGNEKTTDKKCNMLLCLNEIKFKNKSLELTEDDNEKTAKNEKESLRNKIQSEKKCFVGNKQSSSQIKTLSCKNYKDLLKNGQHFYEYSDEAELNELEVTCLKSIL